MSLNWGWQFLTWFIVSSSTVEQIQLESLYSGHNRTAKLGSSFDFLWNYRGGLRRVEWGTKDRDIAALDITLFILDRGGRLIPNVSQYNGRRFSSWNQQLPGQVKFTLNPIKEVDNQVFIFKFFPVDTLASIVFDTVQLLVKGKNFNYVMNFCFIMEGYMKFQNGQVMLLNFNNSERK